MHSVRFKELGGKRGFEKDKMKSFRKQTLDRWDFNVWNVGILREITWAWMQGKMAPTRNPFHGK